MVSRAPCSHNEFDSYDSKIAAPDIFVMFSSYRSCICLLAVIVMTATYPQNDSIDDDVGLQLELGPPPVAPLGVVADGVARAHPEPLGDRSVLLQLLGELALDAERLESGLQIDMED